MMPNNFNIYDFLNNLGIPLTPDSPPLLKFSCIIFILAIICLSSFVNIIFYFSAIYILNHEKFLNKLSSWPRLIKYLKFFNSIRITFIILEIGLFLMCITTIIYGCWVVISAMFS
jgi:hypothetical protein